MYEHIECYRHDLDTGPGMASDFLHFDLKRTWFQNNAPEEEAQRQLSQTIAAQPVIFTMEYALAKPLERMG